MNKVDRIAVLVKQPDVWNFIVYVYKKDHIVGLNVAVRVA